MDANWNPSYDSQSIYRVYRFGQSKECFVYRLIAMVVSINLKSNSMLNSSQFQGTLEEKVYDRSVTKLAIASRVVDEMQITRHYKSDDLQLLYRYKDNSDTERPILKVPVDNLLGELLQRCKNEIFKYHEHQSLLENLPHEELNETEMQIAWDEFNKEKDMSKYDFN